MRALDIYGKLFNFIVEFYCLIILCVKNLGVSCDSALCGVLLCNALEESYPALLSSECISIPPTERPWVMDDWAQAVAAFCLGLGSLGAP